MINPQQKKNRLFIIIIFGMTIIPFLIALVLQRNPELLKGTTNNIGQLIIPPVTTEPSDFIGFDAFSTANLSELSGHWLLTNVIPSEHCNEICLDAVIKIKQLRLMLNKEFGRTRRVVIIFKDVPEASANQWWLKDALLWRLRQTQKPADDALFNTLLREENSLDEAKVTQLIGNEDRETVLKSDLIKIKPTENLLKKITAIRKGNIPDGMLFLIDPLGNIMMQYEPGFDPYKVKNDLMHLLRASQIG
ncbi:MAG: hypothetical protein LUO95_00315 [Methylococcaceae bacterium]|nr:hypothetical protein [Methylococcaceae bacterium]MDD1615538.1 hypothetical protein [Methylococcaceae bacterium]OYV20081.1 MAG: hypothetical protein CG439_625 [Methylococcaceae bacterium NSP1-2]